MSLKTQDKLTNLVKEVQRTASSYSVNAVKSAKRTRLMFTIQTILMTGTTILLGLKLGQIGQSIAFVFSAIATGLSTWYNIDSKKKLHNQILTLLMKLQNLSLEIIFYESNFDPLEEDKFIKYTETYFNILKEFEERTEIMIEDKDKGKRGLK